MLKSLPIENIAIKSNLSSKLYGSQQDKKNPTEKTSFKETLISVSEKTSPKEKHTEPQETDIKHKKDPDKAKKPVNTKDLQPWASAAVNTTKQEPEKGKKGSDKNGEVPKTSLNLQKPAGTIKTSLKLVPPVKSSPRQSKKKTPDGVKIEHSKGAIEEKKSQLLLKETHMDLKRSISKEHPHIREADNQATHEKNGKLAAPEGTKNNRTKEAAKGKIAFSQNRKINRQDWKKEAIHTPEKDDKTQKGSLNVASAEQNRMENNTKKTNSAVPHIRKTGAKIEITKTAHKTDPKEPVNTDRIRVVNHKETAKTNPVKDTETGKANYAIHGEKPKIVSVKADVSRHKEKVKQKTNAPTHNQNRYKPQETEKPTLHAVEKTTETEQINTGNKNSGEKIHKTEHQTEQITAENKKKSAPRFNTQPSTEEKRKTGAQLGENSTEKQTFGKTEKETVAIHHSQKNMEKKTEPKSDTQVKSILPHQRELISAQDSRIQTHDGIVHTHPLDKIVEHIQHIQSLKPPINNTVTVKLNPPHIGVMEIRVKMEKDKSISAFITSHDKNVIKIISNHTSDIKNYLTSQGIKITHIDVQNSFSEHGGFGNGTNMAGNFNGNGTQQNGTQTHPYTPAQQVESHTEAVKRPERETHIAGVDITV